MKRCSVRDPVIRSQKQMHSKAIMQCVDSTKQVLQLLSDSSYIKQICRAA